MRLGELSAELAKAVDALMAVDATLCACRWSFDRPISGNCNCDIHAAHRIMRPIVAAYDAKHGEKA